MGKKGQVPWNKGLKGYLAGHPCYTDPRKALAAQKVYNIQSSFFTVQVAKLYIPVS